MTISKLKTLLQDPVLLITLSCMIASTLISFFLVNKNIYKVDVLESQIRDQKTMVRETSENVNQKRVQVDAAILLDAVIDHNDPEDMLLKKKYLYILPNLNEDSSGVEIIEEFDKYRNSEFDKINDVYIEQIYLENDKASLERKNKICSSIATLLQVLGLAFIIIRKDLSIDNLY